MKNVKNLLVIAATMALLAGCNRGNTPASDSSAGSSSSQSSQGTSEVEGLEMKTGYDSISLGQTLNLEAKVTPSDAKDQKIEYSLSNPDVASVSDDGVVTPKKVGQTTITATTHEGGFQKQITLDVVDLRDPAIGSANGKASSSFAKQSIDSYSIASYSEDDVSYVLFGSPSSSWYLEAEVSNLANNVTASDLTASSNFTKPAGLAGMNDDSIYSFGPVSYQKTSYGGTTYDPNYFDATLTMLNTKNGISQGDHVNFRADLGGEGSYFIDTSAGYKVGILNNQNKYYYFVNDILIGINQLNVADVGMSAPALATYKSGATFSNIKFVPEGGVHYIVDSVNEAIEKQYNETMFANPYVVSETADIHKMNNAVDRNGNLYFTDNSSETILPTQYDGKKFYLEATFNLSSHSDALSSLDSQTHSGGGVGSLSLDASRRMVVGPSNNRKAPTSSTNYIENSTEEGKYREINLTVSKHRGLSLDDNHFKAAVLRDDDICYYFLNDVLVFQDTNKRTWELDEKWTCHPILASVFGGAGKIEGVKLLTNEAEVDAQYKSLNPWAVEKTIPTDKKVKVILMSGQSNCEGVTRIKDLTTEQLEEYDRPYSNVAISYYSYSYTHMSRGKFLEVGFGQGLDESYFGFEVGLAHELSIRDPDNYYVLIKAARGDSDIQYHYRSPSMGGEVGPIYTATVDYINESLQNLKDMGVDFEIEGMCWMQGERDASHVVMAHNYKENFKNLYNDWSMEWNQYCGDEGLRLYDALIKEYEGTYQYYPDVNNAKRELAAANSRHTIIDTTSTDLDLTTLTYDWNHYDAPSELKLGKAFADAILDYVPRSF